MFLVSSHFQLPANCLLVSRKTKVKQSVTVYVSCDNITPLEVASSPQIVFLCHLITNSWSCKLKTAQLSPLHDFTLLLALFYFFSFMSLAHCVCTDINLLCICCRASVLVDQRGRERRLLHRFSRERILRVISVAYSCGLVLSCWFAGLQFNFNDHRMDLFHHWTVEPSFVEAFWFRIRNIPCFWAGKCSPAHETTVSRGSLSPESIAGRHLIHSTVSACWF